MEHHEKAGCLFPKIGMRNVKTALAAALCALVYYFLDRNPTFACIGAIFGMGSSFMQSRLHGGNRFFGTMVGGFIGMGLFAIYMELFPDGSNAWVLIPLTFVGVIILILLCQHIWVGGVQPGGVVLCILLFNTPTDTYTLLPSRLCPEVGENTEVGSKVVVRPLVPEIIHTLYVIWKKGHYLSHASRLWLDFVNSKLPLPGLQLEDLQ